MRTLLILALATSLAAQTKLTDKQKAELYKAYADSTAATSQLTAAQADVVNAQARVAKAEPIVKEKTEAFAAMMEKLKKYCGGAVTEAAGAMADCAEKPKEPEKK